MEQRAREVLAANHEFDEFIMGMGIWTIRDRDGNLYGSGDGVEYKDRFPRLADFDDLMCKLDDCGVDVTGIPMRFTATGKKRTDW